MVVIGDSDFVNNEYIVKGYNVDLFLNAINWLSGEEAIISIRPKSTRGSSVAMTPQLTWHLLVSVLIIPEILLLLGLAIWWRRR